jgi:hypothetical protein
VKEFYSAIKIDQVDDQKDVKTSKKTKKTYDMSNLDYRPEKVSFKTLKFRYIIS